MPTPSEAQTRVLRALSRPGYQLVSAKGGPHTFEIIDPGGDATRIVIDSRTLRSCVRSKWLAVTFTWRNVWQATSEGRAVVS